MTRHKYSRRPEPRFENGLFIPPSPIPVPGEPENWSLIENLKNVRAISRNAIESTSLAALTRPHYKGTHFGLKLAVVSDPELIRNIFVTNHHCIVPSEHRQRILRPIMRDGLISAEGETWSRIRKLTAPMFTPRYIRKFAEGMRTTIEATLPEVFRHGDVIQFNRQILSVVYQVLSDALFSGDIDARKEESIAAIETVLEQMGSPHVFDVLNAPKILPRPGRAKGQKMINNFRNIVTEITEQRWSEIQAGSAPKEDFLGLLMNAQDDEKSVLTQSEIEDQIIAFIGAGHETTSHALTWLMYLLSQSNDILEKVETEIDGFDIETTEITQWEDAVPLTVACIKEAMRLYPPAPYIGRTFCQDLDCGSVRFEKGEHLLLSLWALHRHRGLWENPDSFDPDRFLGERAAKIDRFQYLPFGLGPRVCIGQRFAMQEAVILTVLLLKDYRFEYVGEKPPWPHMRITVRPDNGLPVRVAKR